MKTTKQLSIIALVIAAGFLTSCKKKKTEPTPAQTSVKSFTFSTTNSAWVLNGKEYSAIFTLEEIDANVLSSGAVNVYWGDGTGSSWDALPVTKNNIQCSYGIQIHTVKITMSSASDNIPPLDNPGVQQFKVVVIKGAARLANPQVNWNNYNEVKNKFQLKD